MRRDPADARTALMRIHDALLPYERRFLDALLDVPRPRQEVGLDALLGRYAHMLAEPSHDELAERHIEHHRDQA